MQYTPFYMKAKIHEMQQIIRLDDEEIDIKQVHNRQMSHTCTNVGQEQNSLIGNNKSD